MDKSLYSDRGREYRQQGTVRFPLAYYEGDLVAQSVPMHWHDEFETGFVVEGQMILSVGNEHYTLGEGDGYFINSGVLHAFSRGNATVSRQRSLVFQPSLIGGRTDSVFWQRYCQPMITDAALSCVILEGSNTWQEDCISTLGRTWRCVSNGYEEFELNARHYLSHLLHMLCTHLQVRTTRRSEKEERDSRRIKLMLGYIHEHYSEDLTVADIAAGAMISHSECLRCFHDTVGITPVRYVRDYRVEKAAEQLASGSDPIAEIATRCGFSDLSYFTRTFRELKGYTPGEFRKRAGT